MSGIFAIALRNRVAADTSGDPGVICGYRKLTLGYEQGQPATRNPASTLP